MVCHHLFFRIHNPVKETQKTWNIWQLLYFNFWPLPVKSKWNTHSIVLPISRPMAKFNISEPISELHRRSLFLYLWHWNSKWHSSIYVCTHRKKRKLKAIWIRIRHSTKTRQASDNNLQGATYDYLEKRTSFNYLNCNNCVLSFLYRSGVSYRSRKYYKINSVDLFPLFNLIWFTLLLFTKFNRNTFWN